uniref:Resistin like beta n=3 Tax=Ailuropoda melanoleuca TaxID=9646 RepID=A0A7N5KA70_AILME
MFLCLFSLKTLHVLFPLLPNHSGAQRHQRSVFPPSPRTLLFYRMKSPSCFILMLILLQLMTPGTAPCTLDSIVATKIKEALTALELNPSPTRKLSCISIKNSGRVSSCPAGMVVTGCACGYGCGSWDIRGETTCHCQCSTIDWTTARCCHLT